MKRLFHTEAAGLGLRRDAAEVRGGPRGSSRDGPRGTGAGALTAGSDGQGRSVPRGSGPGAAPGTRGHGGVGGKVTAGSFLDSLAPSFPTQNLGARSNSRLGSSKGRKELRPPRPSVPTPVALHYLDHVLQNFPQRDRPSVFRLCGPPRSLSPWKPLSSAFVAGKQPRSLCKRDECGCTPIKLYLQRLLVGPGGGGLLIAGLDFFLRQWFSPESPDHGAHPQHIRFRRAGFGGKDTAFSNEFPRNNLRTTRQGGGVAEKPRALESKPWV